MLSVDKFTRLLPPKMEKYTRGVITLMEDWDWGATKKNVSVHKLRYRQS